MKTKKLVHFTPELFDAGAKPMSEGRPVEVSWRENRQNLYPFVCIDDSNRAWTFNTIGNEFFDHKAIGRTQRTVMLEVDVEEPEERTITVAELMEKPQPVWVRERHGSNKTEMVTGYDPVANMLRHGETWASPEQLWLHQCEWSTDLKTWNEFNIKN